VRLEDKWRNTKQNAYTRDLAALGLQPPVGLRGSRSSARLSGRGKGKYALAPINHPRAQQQELTNQRNQSLMTLPSYNDNTQIEDEGEFLLRAGGHQRSGRLPGGATAGSAPYYANLPKNTSHDFRPENIQRIQSRQRPGGREPAATPDVREVPTL